MAAPAYVQDSGFVAVSTTSTNITLNGVTSGNTILIGWCQTGSSVSDTGSVSDNAAGGSNDYNSVVNHLSTVNSRRSQIFRAANVVGGNLTIVFALSGAISGQVIAVEIGPDALDVNDWFEDASSGPTHYHAQSGSIDTAADVFVFTIGGLSASGTALTKHADYTAVGTATTQVIAQRRESVAALTDQRAEYTSSTSRTGVGVIASFKAPAGGGPTGSPWYAYAQQ